MRFYEHKKMLGYYVIINYGSGILANLETIEQQHIIEIRFIANTKGNI
jgi:hypothetical protein